MDWISLRYRVQMIPTLVIRQELLQNEIRKAESDVTTLLIKYEKESRDVDMIKKESFSSFLFRLIGKYEDKLDKEQREEISAKLDYDRAVTHLNNLVTEKDDLNSRIASLRDEERAFNTELSIRRQNLSKRFNDQDSIRYTQLEDERNTIISQITEINEALTATSRVLATAKTTLDSLNSAQGWATYDAFTRGGIISHMIKYSHIDDAEQNFHTLSSQLKDLNSELRDVKDLTTLGVNELSSTQRAVDFWFDNIFTDLSVRGQIKDNSIQIDNLIHDIYTIQTSLEKNLSQQEASLKENRRMEEEFLLSIAPG